jgi:hypothetical protein
MTNAIELNPKTTAKLVRTILKAAFPATKFSVRTPRGSMMSSVDISWTDGPTVAAVDAFVSCLKCGQFDSMTDGFDYKTGADAFVIVNGQTYRTGTRYVSTSRTTSPDFARRAAAQVAAYYGVTAPVIGVNAWGSWVVENDHAAHAFANHDWSTLIYQATRDRTRFAA